MIKMAGERLKRYFWFAYFALIVCWGLNFYSSIVSHYRQGTLFVHTENNTLIVSDFVLWYNAGVLAAQTKLHPQDIYDAEIQYAGLQKLVSPQTLDQVQYVQYPPHFFALMRPFALLNLENAWIVYSLLALPLIVAASILLVRRLPASVFTRTFFVVATLTSFPTSYAFEIGQTTLFQFPALVAYWLLLRADNFFLAGLVSVFLTVKLQYAPCVILIGIILGRLRFLLGLLVSASIFFLYTLLTVGWNNIAGYPHALLYGETSAQVGGVMSGIMQNFRGELFLLKIDEHIIHLLAAGLFAAGTIFVVLMWLVYYPRLAKKISYKSFDACASITTVVMLICSPHTHFQDYMAIAIPAALLYPYMKLGISADLKITFLRILIWGFPIISWLSIIFMTPIVTIRVQPYFAWALVVLLLGAWKGLQVLKNSQLNLE